MLGAQWVADRTSGAKSSRRAHEEYAATLAAAEERVRVALVEESEALHNAHPNAAELGSLVCEPTVRLWERHPQDDDFLLVRLGTGSLPSSVRLLSHTGSQPVPAVPLLQDVPITVNLVQVGALGIAGERTWVLGLARFIVGQLAALHSPRHFRLVLLSTHDIETAATSGIGFSGCHM